MSNSARADLNAPQELRLLDYVERIGRRREGRKAVHVHLSKLRSLNRHDYHLRIATNTFEQLVAHYEGELFKLSNHDLVFIFRGQNPLETEEAARRLRYLFNDDPLAEEIDPGIVDRFCSWYDLERHYDMLLNVVRVLCDDAHRRLKRAAAIAASGEPPEEKPPLDPHRLGTLIETLAFADVSNLMRRQTVHAILQNQQIHPLFQELYVSIGELRDTILPNVDITANRWLFQYLTETLDKRMLQLLIRNDDPAISHGFSVNLNIATILSPDFLAFDASLRTGARGTIVLEVQLIDVFADIAAFSFARDFAHERGYRLCLDGLDEQRLSVADREKLKVDLLKLAWAPTMVEDQAPERTDRLRRMVERVGKPHLILNRVDTEEGVRFGQSIGIAMFQGRYVDQLAATRPVTRTR